ncbi:MAG: BACON domain-containing protein [Rikenellaceae bacterium]|nr:BACON domain-containing protein [Rikenellaceae bacterium]
MKKLIWCAVLCCSVLCVGCGDFINKLLFGYTTQKPQDPQGILTVNQTQVVLGPTGDETKATIEVTSNCEWVATSYQCPWLTVTPQKGAGNKQIVLRARNNTSTESRTAEVIITIFTGVTSQTINVIQQGIPNPIE